MPEYREVRALLNIASQPRIEVILRLRPIRVEDLDLSFQCAELSLRACVLRAWNDIDDWLAVAAYRHRLAPFDRRNKLS